MYWDHANGRLISSAVIITRSVMSERQENDRKQGLKQLLMHHVVYVKSSVFEDFAALQCSLSYLDVRTDKKTRCTVTYQSSCGPSLELAV